jgi:hypothetical protein
MCSKLMKIFFFNMKTNKVIIKQISYDLFLVKKDSAIIKIVEFGFILHSMLIENKIYDDDEWYDFSFYFCLKIEDNTEMDGEDFILFNLEEIKNFLIWLDWICKIIINSDGEHNDTIFIKKFISFCDQIFKKFKNIKTIELEK